MYKKDIVLPHQKIFYNIIKMVKKILFFSALLINLTVLAQTTVSGGIFSNTTFTLNNSPYVVTDNLVIFPNVKLIIEPGVEIKFNSGKNLQVRGEILALGNNSNRIIFTSNTSIPAKGNWGGIQILNTLGGKASFEYCDFKFASSSNSSECCYQGGGIYYKYCKFDNNEIAISGYTGYKINIENCEFTNNTYAITQADKYVLNSTFTNNDYGLFRTERIDVNNSTFTNNGTALYGGRGSLQNSTITNNTIGVLGFFEGFRITNNNISNNSIGIQTSNYNGYAAPIKNNQICNNTTYNVENLDNINKDLTDNCWCLENQNLIEQKLKDGYDNVNLGLFNYSIYDNICNQIVSKVLKDPSLTTEDLLSIIENIEVYPNPSTDYLNIKSNQIIEKLNIQLFSIQGQLVFNSTNKNISETRISLTELASGIYILHINSSKGSITKKIIKN